MSRKKHQTYEGLGKKSQEKFTEKKGLDDTKLKFQSKSIDRYSFV